MNTFLALDFETGDSTRDSAIALGLVRCEGGQVVEERAIRIRPPQTWVRFTQIHGLTWRDVCEEPTWADWWPTLRPWFDGVDFLAAHNASFDRAVLSASCQGVGIQAPSLPFVCTVQLARRAWDLRPTRLPDVARHLGVPLNHHDALSDARVCAQAVLRAPEIAAAMVQAPGRARRSRSVRTTRQ